MSKHETINTNALDEVLLDIGSIGTSTTIVSGTDDDRFDVDAVIEADVPEHWDNAHALDLLEESLQGFPGAIGIERCTRCVQLQFPFMHMDVTILDRRLRIAVGRITR